MGVQPVQPDIDYYPNFEKYCRRSSSRLEHEVLDLRLPSGFPDELKSESAWDSSIAREKGKWLFQISAEQVGELKHAVQNFKSKTASHRKLDKANIINNRA
jgi:hypothetical protein